MQHPLIVLLKLQLRSSMRRASRSIKTLRGAFFFTLAVVAIILWLGPNLFVVLFAERNGSEAAREIIPLALLTTFVFSVAAADMDRAIYFTPAEIDFLFPAPFTRQELIAYKLGKTLSGVPLTALCFTVLCLRHVAWWLAAYVGFSLALIFIQLIRMLLVLAGQAMTEENFIKTRKLILFSVALLLVTGLAQTLFPAQQTGPVDLAHGIRQSVSGSVLLAVFDVFALTITADNLNPALIQWGAVATVINLVLCLLIMRLDETSLEISLTKSQKIYERLDRLRRSGGIAVTSVPGSVRWRLPQFPRLSGAGPIARRQLTDALRNARGLIGLLFLMAISVGPVLLVGSRRGGGAGSLSGGFIWMSVFVPMMFRFDFRRDVDHMDWLKLLPLRPMVIVVGELIAPVLITLGLQILLLSGLAPFVEGPRWPLLLALLFALPFNVLLFGIENLMFLLFPVRVTAVISMADLQSFGRQMALSLAKVLLLAPVCALAIILGAVAYSAADDSWLAFAIVAWLTLALAAALTVPCVAWAFRRFDLSRDMPS